MAKFSAADKQLLRLSCKALIGGNTPTLVVADKVFGHDVSRTWLVAQLESLKSFYCCDQMTEEVMEEIASLIMSDYYYLKYSEVWCFFKMLKAGRFGEMYGKLNGGVVMRAMRKFLNVRGETLDELEREERDRQREEWRKNAISYEEYQRRKAAEQC